MKLLPLDRPELIKLAADWLGREENYKWLDFGDGAHALSVISLKLMTQRDLHVLRLFTSDESDVPVGMVALSEVRPHLKIAGAVWAVLGRKRYGAYLCRAVSKLLTLGFTELGLEAVAAWTVETNLAARRVLEQLGFRYIGRLRRRHWIAGRPYRSTNGGTRTPRSTCGRRWWGRPASRSLRRRTTGGRSRCT